MTSNEPIREKMPFVFFDLGQTLIDERDFIEYFDGKFLEILNGFGAKIDKRNYITLRDNIIRDRLIGDGGVNELVGQFCKLVCPRGYSETIMNRLSLEIPLARKKYFHFHADTEATLAELSELGCQLGIIANQSQDVIELLGRSNLQRFFSVVIISSVANLRKPDPEIFMMALRQSGRLARECIMVGDRLDTDICPANNAGMKTIRTTESLFSMQNPLQDCEIPACTAARLSEVAGLVKSIISEQTLDHK